MPNTAQSGYRYYDLRWDEDTRTLSGTLMRYGDVADLGLGKKEKFEPYAFGDVSKIDLLVNVQHERGRPIARTDGGGAVLEDSSERLRLRAELPETPTAAETVELVRRRIYRGFSIEFLPTKFRREGDTLVIEKATLKNVAVVDRPAYPDATLDWRQHMDPDRLQALVEEALQTRAEEDNATLARSLSTVVTSVVSSEMSELRQERDDAIRSRDRAIKDRDREVEKRAAAERAKDDMAKDMAKKREDMDDELEEERKKQREKADDEMRAAAADRADLLTRLDPLFPEDLETRELTNHELLVAAVGDEVPDAEKRSEDYLTAKTEAILERRESAGVYQTRAQAQTGHKGHTRSSDTSSGYSPAMMVTQIAQRYEGGAE